MHFEVEQKFRVADIGAIEDQLRGLGAAIAAEMRQTDCYFAHPSRDFAVTDEALRIRRAGQGNSVAYKGPKIDAVMKTRREIEIPLPDGEELRGVRRVARGVGFLECG